MNKKFDVVLAHVGGLGDYELLFRNESGQLAWSISGVTGSITPVSEGLAPIVMETFGTIYMLPREDH